VDADAGAGGQFCRLLQRAFPSTRLGDPLPPAAPHAILVAAGEFLETCVAARDGLHRSHLTFLGSGAWGDWTSGSPSLLFLLFPCCLPPTIRWDLRAVPHRKRPTCTGGQTGGCPPWLTLPGQHTTSSCPGAGRTCVCRAVDSAGRGMARRCSFLRLLVRMGWRLGFFRNPTLGVSATGMGDVMAVSRTAFGARGSACSGGAQWRVARGGTVATTWDGRRCRFFQTGDVGDVHPGSGIPPCDRPPALLPLIGRDGNVIPPVPPHAASHGTSPALRDGRAGDGAITLHGLTTFRHECTRALTKVL